MSNVLIVDDEPSVCWGLERLLTETGHDVHVAASAEEALERAAVNSPDAILLDVRLPGMDGLSAMRRLADVAGPVPIVIITAFGSLDVAVTAMRNGAFDYLPKPFDLEQAAAVIDRALAENRTPGAVRPSTTKPHDLEFLGTSRAMHDVFKRIALVAPTDASVLITGESGTGKELVARSIHRHSLRAAAPLVPIHLAALSTTLVESELFGHVRGAYTGADDSRQGLLELADGATVFFDEAGDIPHSVQVKLLRVLEQHELTPVGSAEPRATTFRVIAATNRLSEPGNDESPLRRDLYFRLAAFEIALPPLRERVEDIPILAEHFLAKVSSQDSPSTRFTEETLRELCRREWPGNVRQLRHAVEHGALLARGGPIAPEHLPPNLPTPGRRTSAGQLAEAVSVWTREQLAGNPTPGELYRSFLAETEPALFDAALERTHHNRAAAADLLGIHRATLRKKLIQH